MAKIFDWVVTPPPALIPVEDGVKTVGKVYSFTAPLFASEPLTIDSVKGYTFKWAATELYYRDGEGNLDVIFGSAPVEISVQGRQARYERTYPLGDDIFVANAEEIKHFTLLYRKPREYAPFLGSGVEFGVSGVISGVKLPVGRHDLIDVEPFTLPKPEVRDMAGATIYGTYEVVDCVDGTQQLFIWIDADWLLSSERVYPITIDPTVIVNSSYNLTWFTQLKDGRLFLVVDLDDAYAYFGSNNGNTWTLATTPLGGGKLPGNWYCWEFDQDADGVIHMTWIDKQYNSSLKQYLVYVVYAPLQIAGNTISYTSTNISHAAGYDASGYSMVAVSGNQGQTKTVYVLYHYGFYDNTAQTNGREYVRWQQLTYTMTGTVTKTTSGDLASYQFTNGNWPRFERNISRNAAGEVVYAVYSRADSRVTFYNGSGQQILKMSYDVGWMHKRLVGFPKCGWINTSETMIVWADGTTLTLPAKRGWASRGLNDGALIYVSAEGDPMTIVARVLDIHTGAVIRTVTGPEVSQFLIPLEISNSQNIPLVYKRSSVAAIYFDWVLFNQPPLQPSNLTRAPFDATDPAQFTWQYNDPDPFDGQSAYQVQIVLDGETVVDTGWVQSPETSYTLPANTLTNGQTYQWRVRTMDQEGKESPWSNYAVFQTGAKPVATILYPTEGTMVPTSEVTVQWSVPSQSRATVRLYDGTGQTVLQEHEVTTPNTRTRTITGLRNGGSYRVGVQVTSVIGVTGNEVLSGVFNVVYTPPLPAMDVVAAREAAIAAVKLRWRRGWSRPGTFSRNSMAYLPDGTGIGVGQPRYYGGGIMVEEGTTNLLTANQSSVETDTAGFRTYQGATISRSTEEAWEGTASLKVTTPGNTSFEGFYVLGPTGSAGETFTGSLYLKGSGTVYVQLYRDRSILLGEKRVTLTDEWQRVVVTGTLDADGEVQMYIRTAGGAQAVTFYADGLQLENKPYATSWTLGGTSRVAEKLTVSTAGLSPEEGCWRQWVYVDESILRKIPDQWPVVFLIPREGVNSYGIWLFSSSNTGRWGVQTRLSDDDTDITAVHFSHSLTPPNNWHLFEVKWQGSVVCVFVDGQLAATLTDAKMPTSLGSVAYIGSNWGPAFHGNTVYGQTQLLNHYPSDAESLAAYRRGVNNLARDEHTLALHTWANTLEGGTQEAIFSHWGVERSEDGTRWTRIAVIDNPDSGDWVEYIDRAVGSGRPYQYRVVAYGSNGVHTAGPQVVEGIVVFPYDIYVHRADDLSVFAKLRWNPEVSQQSRVFREMAEFAGREHPVVEVGSFREMSVQVSVQVLKQEAKQLELLQDIVNSGIGVLYRDHRGRKIWGHIEGLDITDTWYGWNVSFTVDRMDRKEAV